MSPPPLGEPPGERAHGAVERIVGRVLGYMDTPWKAVAVAALLILIGFGFGLWEIRQEIAGLFRTSGPVTIRNDVSAELDEIIANTSVDLAVVWAVDLANNTMRLVDARQRGGGAWSFTPRRLPAIEAGSNPEAIAKLGRGASMCADPTTLRSVLQRRLAADGIRWDCAVPVPPSHAEPLIGVLYLGWKNLPDAAVKDAALSVAGDAAEHMVMR